VDERLEQRPANALSAILRGHDQGPNFALAAHYVELAVGDNTRLDLGDQPRHATLAHLGQAPPQVVPHFCQGSFGEAVSV
jgi:hypothetical protein